MFVLRQRWCTFSHADAVAKLSKGSDCENENKDNVNAGVTQTWLTKEAHDCDFNGR